MADSGETYPPLVARARFEVKGRPWTVKVGPHEVGAFTTPEEAEPMRLAIDGGMVAHLANNGTCCGKRPLRYRKPRLHDVCLRCHVEYVDGVQVENWAWKAGADGRFRYESRFAGRWQSQLRAALAPSDG